MRKSAYKAASQSRQAYKYEAERRHREAVRQRKAQAKRRARLAGDK